jgi:uncharacterized membrane protein YhaH (DUF805 family)
MSDETISNNDNAPPRRPESPTRRWNWWLAGRSSRREYGVYIVLILALSAVLSSAKGVGVGLTMALIFVQIRRVHDLGRTGWWAVAATLAPLAALLLAATVGWDNAMLIGMAIEIVLLVAIGVIPGEAEENRFGPPPPVTLRRLLTGR